MSSKALVVDPSDTMRKIIVRSLEMAGVEETLDTADGEQAMALINEHEFDLMLTDWEVPGKSGLELLAALRAAERPTVVMMITNKADKENVLQAIQAGVADYLIKPFTGEVLLEKLQKLVRRTAAS